VTNADKDVAIASFNAHIKTHTADADEDEELVRPRITRGRSWKSWNSSQASRKRAKTGAGISETERGLQLRPCCNKEFIGQAFRANPKIIARPEVEQSEATRKLAGILNRVTGRTKALKTPRKVDPPQIKRQDRTTEGERGKKMQKHTTKGRRSR